jgi:hypothetical protein
MAGTSRQAVSNWRARHGDFPRPAASPKSGPVFRRDEIAAWLRRRGFEVKANQTPPRNVRVLRHFKYLNSDLVREFLAQLEGAVFDESQVKTASTSDKGVGAGVSANIAGIKADLSKSTTSEHERTEKQTAASEFARLFAHLESQDLVQSLPAFDDVIWTDLQAGEIVEVPVTVAFPGFYKLLQLTAGFQALLPLLPPSVGAVTDEQRAMLKLMSDFGAVLESGPLTVIATVATANKNKMVAPLLRQHVRVSPESLEGEATILAKIQRKLRRGDVVSAVELFPGMNKLSPKQLADFDRTMQGPSGGLDLGKSVISYPGVVVTPIALYQ